MPCRPECADVPNGAWRCHSIARIWSRYDGPRLARSARAAFAPAVISGPVRGALECEVPRGTLHSHLFGTPGERAGRGIPLSMNQLTQLVYDMRPAKSRLGTPHHRSASWHFAALPPRGGHHKKTALPSEWDSQAKKLVAASDKHYRLTIKNAALPRVCARRAGGRPRRAAPPAATARSATWHFAGQSTLDGKAL